MHVRHIAARYLAFLSVVSVALLLPVGVSVASPPGVSATAYPNHGTAQRRAILDAMRPAVEARLGKNVEFVIERIVVNSGWAFVAAKPQRKGGKHIDGAAWFGEEWQYMDGLMTTAVLRYDNGR